jgi:hypothetical protein
MILLVIMRRMSLPSVFHEKREATNLFIGRFLRHSNGNFIESNEIIKNFVALKDKEKEGIERSLLSHEASS